MTTSDSISILLENQETKICRKCGAEKPFSEFHKDKSTKDGVRPYCKICVIKRIKKYYEENKEIISKKGKEYRENNKEACQLRSKRYYENNKESINKQIKDYRENNKEACQLRRKRYHEQNREANLKRSRDHYYENRDRYKLMNKQRYENNKEKILEYSKQWVEKNPEKKREYSKKYNHKIRSTPKGHLNSTISKRINESLNKGMKAGRSWEKLVGYDVDKLKKYLEKQFDDNMSWDNYGSYWHIDHIIPIAAFNFEKPEDDDFKKCWSLKNLRPLESKVNMSKGAKIEKPFQPSLVF